MLDTKICPYCSEEIKATAIKCKHCGSMLTDGGGGTPMPLGTSPGGAGAGWHNSSTKIPQGTEVREYRIARQLGEGGMGEVYLAEHTYTGQKVAMKVVNPLLMQDQNVRRRFLEEGRVMAGLKHPNIVTLHAFFEEGGRFFLVMEFVDGAPLDRILARARETGQRMTLDSITSIMRGILAGMAFAHEQTPPVVHRDIKPQNVLMDEKGRPVITDFGIAKALGREKLTRTRGVVGTCEYISPEQVTGDPVTPASDVYAAGIVLFELLSGRVPFPQTSDTGIEVMDGHRHQPPPDIRTLREDCPPDLQRIVAKALAKEPRDRYTDGAEMYAAIPENALNERPLSDLSEVKNSSAHLVTDEHPMSNDEKTVVSSLRAQEEALRREAVRRWVAERKISSRIKYELTNVFLVLLSVFISTVVISFVSSGQSSVMIALLWLGLIPIVALLLRQICVSACRFYCVAHYMVRYQKGKLNEESLLVADRKVFFAYEDWRHGRV